MTGQSPPGKDVFEILDDRMMAYVQVFSGPSGQKVVEDLAEFCRAYETGVTNTGGAVDPILMAYLAGRRDVFLRIQQYSTLDRETLYQRVMKKGT